MSLMNFIADAVCSSPLGFNICHLLLHFALIPLKKEKGNNQKDQCLLLLLITYIKSNRREEMPSCLPAGAQHQAPCSKTAVR